MPLKKDLEIKYEDIGPYKKPKHHVKKASQRKYSSKANEKIHHVIREFEEGKLHSGSKKGPKVTHLPQAVAIGINEARRKGEKVSKKK